MFEANKMFRSLLIYCGPILILLSSYPVDASSITNKSINLAFLHTDSSDHQKNHQSHHNHHGKGCFITTTPQNHARGIRHWVHPCPHKELKHMNPYHPPHHKL